MKFSQLLRPEHVLVGAKAADASHAIRQLVQLLAATGALKEPERALPLVLEREREYATGIGAGVAIPHCNCLLLPEGLVAAGLFDNGVDFGAPDGPARLVLLLLSPPGNSGGHLKLLARISRLARHGLCQRLAEQATPEAVILGFAEAERDFLDL
ncbi:MAG: PTS sugar transporter subunit IIA [bacterium]|jgi:PTS system fructose-specific IIA component|nr:PTS sugar transporter subunit IIA [bacterium]